MRAERANSEAMIQKGGRDLMELDGWMLLKTDPEWMRGLGVSEPGIADDQFIRYDIHEEFWPFEGPKIPLHYKVLAQVLWIEWKKKGGKAGAHQATWHQHMRWLGAVTLIAGENFEASIDGFTKWYMESGLARKVKPGRRK